VEAIWRKTEEVELLLIEVAPGEVLKREETQEEVEKTEAKNMNKERIEMLEEIEVILEKEVLGDIEQSCEIKRLPTSSVDILVAVMKMFSNFE